MKRLSDIPGLERRHALEDLHNLAEEIRTAHCSFKGDGPHECQGQCLITKEGVCLACPLCGRDDYRGDGTNKVNVTDKRTFVL